MTVVPAFQAADKLWSEMRPLLARLLTAPRSPYAGGNVSAAPGIYLFSVGQRYRYVGQTRNLRARLGNTRTQPGHITRRLSRS